LLSVDDVSRSPDQSRIRKCPENRDSQRVPLLPSPLLYGPFLISPRRNQNATPRISTPKQPCPDIKSQRQKPLSSGSGVASGTPTRRGPPWAPNQAIPAGLPASRFRIFLLIEYPYTTLSSRAGRRLSTHAHLSEYILSPRYCNRPEPRPTSQCGDLLRLSLISVWSDMRRHRLLPTRRARRDERRLSADIAESRVLQTALPCSSRFT
jgi:hypothetical protein